MEGQKRVSFGTDSVEGDDERTENEPSPTSRPREPKRPRTGSSASAAEQRNVSVAASGGSNTDRPRRAPRTRNRPNHRRSSSASGSETGQAQEGQQMAPSIVPSNNHHQSGGSPRQAQDNIKNGGAPHQSKVNDTLRRRRRNNRKRNHRKWKPYARLTWEEKKELDELESKRATKKRANRPTPYNTTQFLMEDHKVDTPDLSAGGNHIPGDSSDELFDEHDDIRDGDFLEKEFSAMYDEVQSERLQSMSKEQLVSEVLTLSKRVTELEETRQAENRSSDGEQMNGHLLDEDPSIRARLESLDDLEHEVKRLREENTVLKKTTHHSQGLIEST